MVRIAALDDETCWIETLSEITQEVFEQREDDEFEFFGYTNTEKFLFDMEERREYDIVLLDMEMNGTDGLKIGRRVRLGHPEATIVYVTNYVDYAVQAYEVNAFRYIPKCMMKEKLPEAYALLVEKLRTREKKFFSIHNNDKMMKIPEDSIYYVQKEKKYVNVVYVDKEERKEKVRMTLAEAYDRLTKQDFLYIDRSCIVNIMHIMALENRKVKLRNGIYLDISQPLYANVRRQISDYWSNRG